MQKVSPADNSSPPFAKLGSAELTSNPHSAQVSWNMNLHSKIYAFQSQVKNGQRVFG